MSYVDRLQGLVDTIQNDIDKIRELENNGESSRARALSMEIADMSQDIAIASAGPVTHLRVMSMSYHDTAAMSVMIEYDIVHKVPDEGSISFKELAKISGAPPDALTRLMRLLIVKRIFTEPEEGYVAHSEISLAWKTMPMLDAFVGHGTHDALPAAAHLVDALKQWGDDEAPNHTAFNLSRNTEEGFFDYMSKQPKMYKRFNTAMATSLQDRFRSGFGDIYPWTDLGKATFVDIGGGRGHIAKAIARANDKLKVVVQDLPPACKDGRKYLDDDLTSRFSFQEHNMFEPQPLKNVDVFFLRHIFHDWPDSWCVKILKQLIPAMKAGSRVLIADTVLPPFEAPDKGSGLYFRYKDIHMMSLLNARERTVAEFEKLFTQADPRLQFNKAWFNTESQLAGGIMEAIFTG